MAIAIPIASLTVSALLVVLLTPWAAKLGTRIGAVAQPGERTVHEGIIPRFGGLAIIVAALVVDLALLLSHGALDKQTWGWILGALLVFALGAVDDCRSLPARLKLLGQILAALIPVLLGVRILFLRNPFGGTIALNTWGIPFTVIWIVVLTNAINLIDGLDGLAAGVCAIAGVTMTAMALVSTPPMSAVALLSATLAGASLGFLYHNFNPARVFMGDSGAYFLGYSLACLSVMGALKTPVGITVVIPLLLFGLPIFDTLFAVARRIVRLKPVLSHPDKGHIHHRLLRLGMTQRQAVLAIYSVTGALCLVAFLLYRR